MPEWQLSDYVSFMPAFQIGAQVGTAQRRTALEEQQLEQSRRHQEIQEQLERDRFQLDKTRETRQLEFQANQDRRAAEDQRYRQLEILARAGVDPTMTPDKQIDVIATSRAMRRKLDRDRTAEALGLARAWDPKLPMTFNEGQFLNEPEYQRSLAKGRADQAKEQMHIDRIVEGIKARQEAKPAKPATITVRDTVTGQPIATIPVPVEQVPEAIKQYAPKMPEGGQPIVDAIKKTKDAIDTLNMYEGLGYNVDIDEDKEGMPKVTRSKFRHDINAGDTAAFQAARNKLNEKLAKLTRLSTGAVPAPAPAPGMTNAPPGMTNAPPVPLSTNLILNADDIRRRTNAPPRVGP